MKTHLSILLIVISSVLCSQTEIYSRIKLKASERLFKTGVSIDHASHHGEELITELSATELMFLQQKGITYEVLIQDMAHYYETRNKTERQTQILSTGCNTFNIPTPAHFRLGSMGGFYTLAEMENALDSMKLLFPNLITVKQAISPITTIEGRTIYYVKISDNPNADEPEPKMLYNSLHHAREPASLSQLLFYMWYLLENYQTDPEIQALVNNTELFFVPCINPDGYVYNQTTNPNGGGMWRKNRRNNGNSTFGVDINRNYGYNWGYDNSGSSNTSSMDNYRGPSPFSEPETQAMRDFCNNHNFSFCISNHAYSNVLIYPWGYVPNALTPDSSVFKNWAAYMTAENQYPYGTPNQMVGYVGNGSSDDWMYGEQSTKAKLLSMSPEAGLDLDGFWPAQNRIVDVCKSTFYQNLKGAWLITNFATLDESNDQFMTQNNGYFNYTIKRLGLENGSFTVSIVPLSSNITSVGQPKIYPNLNQLQSQKDSISFTLAAGITPGTPISYVYQIDNGFYVFKDTITKTYGTPVIVFQDNCSNTSQWTATGWNITSTQFVSPNSCITDSPSGNYTNNLNKSATITSTLNLTDAIYAHLQFYTKYKIEQQYDWVQLQISTNGGSTYAPLCSKHTITGLTGTAINQPIYTGIQSNWFKDEIDLSAYAGQTIKLRFNMKSDGGTVDDGFYFDDVLLRKIVQTTTGISETVKDELVLYPNPASDVIYISEQHTFTNYKFINQLGQVIKSGHMDGSLMPVHEFANGIYYLQLEGNSQDSKVYKVVINRG